MNPMIQTQRTNQTTSVQSGAKADVWVVLWSQSQNALHVERLSDMVESNRTAFLENRRMDYVPLGVGSRAEIESIANEVRPTVYARAEESEIPVEQLP